MSTSTDQIERQILIAAPRERVWRALSSPEEFGAWFGFQLDGAFIPGSRVSGKIVQPPGYEHLRLELWIEEVEPEHRFSYRWHPYAIDPDTDYRGEPTTLVEFRLAEAPEGTRVTVTESGFDRIPLARRAEAFRMNAQGWDIQVANLERYVTGRAGVA